MPDSVISSCQIDNHSTGLLFCLKRVLHVLRKQNDLIYGRLPVTKSSLVPLGARGRLLIRRDCRSVVRGSCKERRADRRDDSFLGFLQVFRA